MKWCMIYLLPENYDPDLNLFTESLFCLSEIHLSKPLKNIGDRERMAIVYAVIA